MLRTLAAFLGWLLASLPLLLLASGPFVLARILGRRGVETEWGLAVIAIFVALTIGSFFLVQWRPYRDFRDWLRRVPDAHLKDGD